MRVLALAAVLLAASSLHPSVAQDDGKAPAAAPQTAPGQNNQNYPPHQDRQNGREQNSADNREPGRDWRSHPGDGEHMGRMDENQTGRDDREMGRDWRMHRDRERSRDRDMDRYRYSERGDRDWDRRDGRGYYDEDRSRRRMKICIEYENGDEYCRYRN
jgi:hypothetical protein